MVELFRPNGMVRELQVKNTYAEHAEAQSYAEVASRPDVATHSAQALSAARTAPWPARGRVLWSGLGSAIG